VATIGFGSATRSELPRIDSYPPHSPGRPPDDRPHRRKRFFSRSHALHMTALSAHHVGITVANPRRRSRSTATCSICRSPTDSASAARRSPTPSASRVRARVRTSRGGRCPNRTRRIRARSEGSPTAGLNQPGASPRRSLGRRPESFAEALPEDVPTLSEPRTTESGTTIMFLRDPEGNLIEVLEA